MENVNPNIARVQHVAKSSSDQLLRKFAEVGSESKDKISAKKEQRLAKRLKRSQAMNKSGSHYYADKDSTNSSSALAERSSLLPPGPSKKPVAMFKRIGAGKYKIKAKELKSKSIMGAFEKTWRCTIKGASRLLMEKHYNRHKRLISDKY